METKLMEYILSIAKHRSISRAAEELYLTQSALNQQLLKLGAGCSFIYSHQKSLGIDGYRRIVY